MKKSLLSLVVAGLFAMSVTSAFATEKVTPSTTNNYDQRNYSTTNQGGNASQGQLQGQQQGQGQSQSATGGSATIQKGAVQNTVDTDISIKNSVNAESTSSVKNSGNSFSESSATIQKGAVQNTNTNTAKGGAGGSAVTGASTSNANNTNTVSGNNNGGAGGAGGSVRDSGNSTNLNLNESKATGGNATANGNGNISEGAVQTEVNIDNSTNAKTYRPPVSSAIAPTIFPTAPCMGSSSVGATGTLFSISGGTTWTSEECMILETARSFDQAGYLTDGLSVRCQGKWAKSAPSCKALAEAGKPAKAAEMALPAKAVMAKPAVAETNVVKPTKAVAQVTVADPVTNAIVYSPNGYYSTVTNPLGQ